MGVDTNIIVAVDKREVINIVPIVEENISIWQRRLLDEQAKLKKLNRMQFLYSGGLTNEKGNMKWSNGVRNIRYDKGCFSMYFTVDGEKRNLFINYDCEHSDTDVHEGEKIYFSLGKWGKCAEIMHIIAQSVREYGDVYYQINDCSTDYKKVEFSEDLDNTDFIKTVNNTISKFGEDSPVCPDVITLPIFNFKTTNISVLDEV